MDTFLIILGLLGLGVILVSAYVFTVAARTYVSDQQPEDWADEADAPTQSDFVDRATEARRQQTEVQAFPITVDGEVIEQDRRGGPDRRESA